MIDLHVVDHPSVVCTEIRAQIRKYAVAGPCQEKSTRGAVRGQFCRIEDNQDASFRSIRLSVTSLSEINK